MVQKNQLVKWSLKIKDFFSKREFYLYQDFLALKAKNDEKDELSEDEDAKLKSYITRQFKKFIKNANVKDNDKDRKQFTFSQFKSQDKTKREAKDGGQNSNVPSGLKCYGC